VLGYRSKLAATPSDNNEEKMKARADGMKRLAEPPLLPISPVRSSFLYTKR
jgi:hypothetical protein